MYKFLIAVDGSEHANRAIRAVARLAQEANDVEAVLINVREGWVSFGDLPPLEYKSLEEAQVVRQDDLLEKARIEARQCGLSRVSCEALRGLIATEIVGAADAHSVDQIAMGTHGRGMMGTLFVGSVAQRVLHLSSVPVLLVK